MSNNILFGTIGLLMLGILGIGARAVYAHPEAVTQVTHNISEKVEDAISVVAGNNKAPSLAISEQNASINRNTPDDSSGKGTGDLDDDEFDEEEDDDDSLKTTIASSPSATTKTTPPKSTTTSANTFTMAQVATHNSAASCYSAISGSVYDLTPFINQHPGGSAAIKSLCGVDGTAAFTGKHGGQARPASELASLKIGTLAP